MHALLWRGSPMIPRNKFRDRPRPPGAHKVQHSCGEGARPTELVGGVGTCLPGLGAQGGERGGRPFLRPGP
eukprot:8920871-Pyramimonas_sp.AAC.1